MLYNAGIETNCFVIQYSLNDSKDMVSEVMKNHFKKTNVNDFIDKLPGAMLRLFMTFFRKKCM